MKVAREIIRRAIDNIELGGFEPGLRHTKAVEERIAQAYARADEVIAALEAAGLVILPDAFAP